jgi:hypothetical protein
MVVSVAEILKKEKTAVTVSTFPFCVLARVHLMVVLSGSVLHSPAPFRCPPTTSSCVRSHARPAITVIRFPPPNSCPMTSFVLLPTVTSTTPPRHPIPPSPSPPHPPLLPHTPLPQRSRRLLWSWEVKTTAGPAHAHALPSLLAVVKHLCRGCVAVASAPSDTLDTHLPVRIPALCRSRSESRSGGRGGIFIFTLSPYF